MKLTEEEYRTVINLLTERSQKLYTLKVTSDDTPDQHRLLTDEELSHQMALCGVLIKKIREDYEN